MNTKQLLAAILFLATPVIADVEHGPPPATALPMPFVIEFASGATVDFADFKETPAGPLRGYVYARLGGELVVIPVYQPEAPCHVCLESPPRDGPR